MGKEEVLSGLLMELRRGTIVLSVLSQLSEPRYGYSLVTILTEYGMPVETNTLYPLLRRLEGQGLLISEWNTEESKPRKYYCITPEGKEVYEKLKKQWRRTVESAFPAQTVRKRCGSKHPARRAAISMVGCLLPDGKGEEG